MDRNEKIAMWFVGIIGLILGFFTMTLVSSTIPIQIQPQGEVIAIEKCEGGYNVSVAMKAHHILQVYEIQIQTKTQYQIGDRIEFKK